MLEALEQDIRSACRGLWRAKAFTAVATLTLALGITGTTVMFAVVDGVLLRGMLFEVDPLDAPTLALAALLLILASLLAAYVPTRRARRLDAAAMLRCQ
jgi:hypothetical protein